MSKRVHLGLANVNGISFAATQDTLIKLKFRFEPILKEVDYEFKRSDELVVYVNTEEDRKRLQDVFYDNEQSVRIVTISGAWEILHDNDPRPQAAATPPEIYTGGMAWAQRRPLGTPLPTHYTTIKGEKIPLRKQK